MKNFFKKLKFWLQKKWSNFRCRRAYLVGIKETEIINQGNK